MARGFGPASQRHGVLKMIEVSCVNVAMSVAITEDGQELPIANAFDRFGDDCDLAEAETCVAGPDKDGLWLTIDFSKMERVALQ